MRRGGGGEKKRKGREREFFIGHLTLEYEVNIHVLEMLGKRHPVTGHNIPEERRSQL
jgi:hypothetical protein